jgi:hypothetical protein
VIDDALATLAAVDPGEVLSVPRHTVSSLSDSAQTPPFVVSETNPGRLRAA